MPKIKAKYQQPVQQPKPNAGVQMEEANKEVVDQAGIAPEAQTGEVTKQIESEQPNDNAGASEDMSESIEESAAEPVAPDVGEVKDESSTKSDLQSFDHKDDPIADGTLKQAIDETAQAAEPAQAPVQEPTQAPAMAVEAVSEKSEEQAYLDEIRVKGSTEQKRILAAIETFSASMTPRAPVEPEKGVKIQYEFLQHLLWLLEKDYDVFRPCWSLLLVYFFVNHGKNSASHYTPISEFSTNRFSHAWTKGAETNFAYRNLIQLLRATRNKETRKHDIKTIKLEAIAPTVLSEKALGNLRKFYEI